MLGVSLAARGVRSAVCALLIAGLASPAWARKAARPAAVSMSAAELIPIPRFSSTPDPAPVAADPARFFTINGAIARRDAGRSLNDPVRLATAAPTEALADILESTATPNATPDEPFGLHAFRAPEGQLWLKWRRLQEELKVDDTELKSCRTDGACTAEAEKFATLARQAKAASGRDQLVKVNQLVNATISYASDLSIHGQLDRWTAPLATLKLGKGDCEDYAILKYRLLVEAGMSENDLRIVLVRDTSVRIDHAVLSARVDNRWYVLDNRKSAFYGDRDLPHYLPLFALDHGGVKLFAAPFAALQTTKLDGPVLPGLNDEAPAMSVDVLPLVL